MDKQKEQKHAKKERISSFLTIRFLAWSIIIISFIGLLNNLIDFFSIKIIQLNILASVLGIIAGILLLQKKKVGITLALVWSALQFVSFQYNNIVISFIQEGINLGINYSFISDPLIKIYINALAIVFFYLFYKKRTLL